MANKRLGMSNISDFFGFGIYKKARIDFANGMNDLQVNIEKERTQWRKQVDLWKSEAVKYENRYWDEVVKPKPMFEFVLDNRETGWVWGRLYQDVYEIKIGDEIELEWKENDVMSTKKFIIEKFDSYKDLIMSFFVKPTTNE